METKTKPANTHPKLPMGDGKGGTLQSVDGKKVLYSPPDPEVKKKAEKYAYWLDEQQRTKTNGNDAAQELTKAFLKSKKARRVTIPGATQTYTFWTDSHVQLRTKKEKALK